jgi:hypothetical protein
LVGGELLFELLDDRPMRLDATFRLCHAIDQCAPLALEDGIAARDEIVHRGDPTHAAEATTRVGRGAPQRDLLGTYSGARSLSVPRIFHFTDVGNLAAILAAGELRCHSTAACAVDVADATIKSRRMSKRVPCGPGGTVGEYVPFYFATRSPMLFRIQRGGVEGVSSDPSRLVYLTSSTEAVLDAGHACVYTDGNAAAAFTRFHDDVARLGDVVDWELMRATMWANTPDDPDRRRRRGAEFLVHQALPLELVDELGVYDGGARAAVAAAAATSGWDVAVHIRSGWYF